MTSEYPLLRRHVRRRKDGTEVTYYYYDRRSEKKPQVSLGTDFDAAVTKWKELHNGIPDTSGMLQVAFTRWREQALPKYTNKETKRCYELQLRRIERAFGEATWDGVKLTHLIQYLELRSAKVQANREMSVLSIVWNWARKQGLTELPFPAAGLKRSQWKNKESAREIGVTDEVCKAIYQKGCQVVRTYIDVSTSTGLRQKDCRELTLPVGNELMVTASKTGKKAVFRLEDSEVLPGLIEARRALEVPHDRVLTDGCRPVAGRKLRKRWYQARQEAVTEALQANRPDLAQVLKRLISTDMRKFASDQAEDLEAASKLLQHDDLHLTRKHYRRKPEKLKPVR
jgi:hypothetical protein